MILRLQGLGAAEVSVDKISGWVITLQSENAREASITAPVTAVLLWSGKQGSTTVSLEPKSSATLPSKSGEEVSRTSSPNLETSTDIACEADEDDNHVEIIATTEQDETETTAVDDTKNTDTISDLNKTVANLTKTISHLKKKNQLLDEETYQLREEKDEFAKHVGQSQKEQDILKEEHANSDAQNKIGTEDLQKRVNQLEIELENSSENFSRIMAQLIERTEKNKTLVAALAKKPTRKKDPAKNSKDMTANQNELKKLVAQLQQQNNNLLADLKTNDEEWNTLNGRLVDREQEHISKLDTEIQMKSKLTATWKSRLAENSRLYEERIAQLQKEIESLASQLENEMGKRFEFAARLELKKAELSTTEHYLTVEFTNDRDYLIGIVEQLEMRNEQLASKSIANNETICKQTVIINRLNRQKGGLDSQLTKEIEECKKSQEVLLAQMKTKDVELQIQKEAKRYILKTAMCCC